MTEMRSIEIDFDIHKLIETNRQSFSETPNNLLRRLLGLGEQKHLPQKNLTANHGAWTGKGVTLPEGTQLRMEYRGQQHLGVIENASWLVEGQKFKSPSAAAGETSRTKAGTMPSLDGWKYWFVKRPGDEGWVPLSSLRNGR